MVRAEVIFATIVLAVALFSTPVVALALAVVSLVCSIAALARANQAVRQVEPTVDAQTRAIRGDA